jgi:hypothetical protein
MGLLERLGRGDRPRPVSTVHLGQFTWEHANDIAADLEDAGIAWWYKSPGFFSQIWEFGGVRLFVDRTRLDEAKAIAERVVAADRGPGGAAEGGEDA